MSASLSPTSPSPPLPSGAHFTAAFTFLWAGDSKQRGCFRQTIIMGLAVDADVEPQLLAFPRLFEMTIAPVPRRCEQELRRAITIIGVSGGSELPAPVLLTEVPPPTPGSGASTFFVLISTRRTPVIVGDRNRRHAPDVGRRTAAAAFDGDDAFHEVRADLCDEPSERPARGVGHDDRRSDLVEQHRAALAPHEMLRIRSPGRGAHRAEYCRSRRCSYRSASASRALATAAARTTTSRVGGAPRPARHRPALVRRLLPPRHVRRHSRGRRVQVHANPLRRDELVEIRDPSSRPDH